MLRVLSADDAPKAAAIHATSFDRPWPEADMVSHIQSDIALGWFEGVKLAGFIIIRLAVDQAEILTVAVDSAFQRMGVGLKLIQRGEISAREAGAEILFLEVAEDNAAAIGLYKRTGFESFGRRPAYYKRADGRMAARLFRKNLSKLA